MCGITNTDSRERDLEMNTNRRVEFKLRATMLKKSNNVGFTLIELMVAMVIGIIVIGGLINIYQQFVASVTAQNVGADLQLSGRAAIEYMVREIRMAGFTQSTPDKDKFGIEEAQSSKIRFTIDHIDSGATDPFEGIGELDEDEEEIITYYLDPADSGLKRQLNENTVNMSRQPLVGGTNGQIQVSSFNLAYLDENNNVISNPNSNTSLIRSVIVTLTARAPAGRAGMIERTFVNRVRCRNLGS